MSQHAACMAFLSREGGREWPVGEELVCTLSLHSSTGFFYFVFMTVFAQICVCVCRYISINSYAVFPLPTVAQLVTETTKDFEIIRNITFIS